MEKERIEGICKALDDFEVKSIDDSVNFWMIRSQGGYYYKEYIREAFVALGWNVIDQHTVFNQDNLDVLKIKMNDIYSTERPTDGINKSKRFIYEVKEGDYVLIPSKGSAEIAICKIGAYYEVGLDYSKEITAMQKIRNEESEIGDVKCPFNKRRHIEVLLRVNNKRLGYKLSKAISPYHGLSSMNDYATDILNCLFDCYLFKDDLYIPINISKPNPIRAKELSGLMYGVTNLFAEMMEDEKFIFATININSEGKYVVRLKSIYKRIKNGALPLIGISVFLFGGEFMGAKMNGAVHGVMGIMKEAETKEFESEKRKEELKKYKLDNCLKALEIIEKKESLDSNIDLDVFEESIKIILDVDQSLKLVSNKEFAKEDSESIGEEIVDGE